MLELAGIAIEAASVAGVETTIQVPAFDLAFDMGSCTRNASRRSTVAFTHGHVDHMGALATHCATRALVGQPPPTYVVPRVILGDVQALLDAWRRLDFSEMPCSLRPVDPGDAVSLGKGVELRVHRAIHRVPTLAYVVWSRRRRLREDLVGQPPSALTAARARGEDISQLEEFPEFAFTGDTRIELFEWEPVFRRARVLVMEVTFLDGRVSVERARAKGHVHLDEVIDRAGMFENRAILFTHLSQRYSYAEGVEILDRRLPRALRERVTLLPQD